MMNNDHNDRMERALHVHRDLLEALLGVKNPSLDLDILAVVYELSEADQPVIEGFIAKCQATRAAAQYTIRDLAAKFKVSESTIRREIASGALRGRKRGGRWLFTDKEIERFLKSRTYLGSERVYPDTERKVG
jgi:excisionase family DNA binding protein